MEVKVEEEEEEEEEVEIVPFSVLLIPIVARLRMAIFTFYPMLWLLSAYDTIPLIKTKTIE